ncbi:MAG: DUF5011 domain-containing protein, partial [Acholeplasmatales bacterium]
MLKKLMLFLTVFALVFTIVGCGERTDDNGDNGEPGDTIPPILTVNPETVVLEYGAPYDLMTGVSALDNIDGTITSQVQVDDGGFDPSVPGTYTITYTVSDSSDNTVTKTRTITVNEPRPTIEIEGAFFPLAVNPQLKFRDNVHANVFPTGYAVAFEADYYDWLIQNQPRRTLARWSIVIVVDEDGNVIQSRDFFTNETNEGAESSRVGTDWCTGTPTGVNNQWCLQFGMLANLDIPENGYVVVFPNDGVNDEGTPRFFGAQFYAVPGETPAERL